MVCDKGVWKMVCDKEGEGEAAEAAEEEEAGYRIKNKNLIQSWLQPLVVQLHA